MINNLLEVLQYNMTADTPWIDIIEMKLLAASAEGKSELYDVTLTPEQEAFLVSKGLKVFHWYGRNGNHTKIHWGMSPTVANGVE